MPAHIHIMNLYNDKDDEYFNSVRVEILPLLPEFSSRILEIGCGAGNTLAWLKKIQRCRETSGIELMKDAADKARVVVDNIIVADIERDVIRFPENHFDLILCLDVLEHLRDPWSVLRMLVEWLHKDGVLIVSVPNLRYKSVLVDLLFKGQFEYQGVGILDRSHLRFFTRKSVVQLMRAAGLEDIRVLLHPDKIGGLMSLVNNCTFGCVRDIFSWQILVCGNKSEDMSTLQVDT